MEYNDRELLELVADVAGMQLYWHTNKSYKRPEMDSMDAWNPLNDNSDAFELLCDFAVNLRTKYLPHATYIEAYIDGYDSVLETIGDVRLKEVQTREQATRRAIVRAVAKIAELK